MSLAHQSHPEFEYFRPLWTFLRKAGIADVRVQPIAQTAARSYCGPAMIRRPIVR